MRPAPRPRPRLKVTHEPTLAPAAPKAGPSHVAPATPAVVTPPREPAKGEVFTRALIKIMDDQVNRHLVRLAPQQHHLR